MPELNLENTKMILKKSDSLLLEELVLIIDVGG